jgi:hypothetical protein
LKTVFIAVLAIAITACATPPKVSTSFAVKRTSRETVAVTLKVKNLENRPTTPIQIDMTAQMHAGNAWSRPESILHPAAFVLNRNEEHKIPANLKTDADAIRFTLVVKEAETGHVLKTERSQVPVPSESGS